MTAPSRAAALALTSHPNAAATARAAAARRTIFERPLKRAEPVGRAPTRRTVVALGRVADVLHARRAVASHRNVDVVADGLIVEVGVTAPDVFGTVDRRRISGSAEDAGDDRRRDA